MRPISANARFILLLVIVVAICVLAALLTISRFQSTPEPTENTRPQSDNVLPSNPVEEEGVVDVPSQSNDSGAGDDDSTAEIILSEVFDVSDEPTPPNNPRATQESPYSIDDLSHLDLGLDAQVKPEVDTPPNPAPPGIVPPAPVEPPVILDEPEEVVSELPSMKGERFSACGEVEVPTGFGLAFFALSVARNPTVVCLGEAIASNSCGNDSAIAITDGEEIAQVYVAKRSDDDVCSVGATVGEGVVSLCSVETIMNLGSGTNQSMKDWQAVFAADPGGTFADMYFDNMSALSDPAVLDVYDCKLYEI